MNFLKKIGIWHIVLLAIIIFLLLLNNSSQLKVVNLTAVVQSLLLGVFTLSVVLTEIKENNSFSPLFFISLLFFVHYALPGVYFNIYNLYVDVQNSLYVNEALNYIIFAYLCIVIFSKIIYPSKKISERNDRITFNEKRLLNIVIIFELIGTVCKFLIITNNLYFQVTRASRGELDGPFYALIIFFETLPIYAVLAAFIYHLKTGSQKWRIIFIVTFLMEFIYWLPTGRKEEVINLIIFPIFIFYLIKRTFPTLKFIVPVAVFLFFLFPLTKSFRDAIGGSIVSNQQLSVSGITDIIAENATISSDGLIDDNDNYATIKRLGIVEETAAIMKLTNKEGFLNGKAYSVFFAAFIPRILWPEKPELNYGKEFGHLIGFISSDDDITSTSISIPSEAYWNFQYFGVIILLIVFSAAQYLFNNIASSPYQSASILLYLLFLKTFLYLGSDFVSAYTGVVKFFIIFLLVVRYLKPSRMQYSKLVT